MLTQRRSSLRAFVFCVLPSLAVVLAGCSSCGATAPPTAATAHVEPAQFGRPDVRLAIVTDLKGYLEPCGCTSRPLGGIDRLAAQIESLRSDGVPLVFAASGGLLFDASHGAGEERAGAEQQEIWKAETLVTILGSLGLDAVSLGAHDLRYGASVFEPLTASARFPFLAAGSRLGEAALAGHRVTSSGDLRVGIIGLSDASGGLDESRLVPPADLVDAARREVEAARGEGADLIVLLANADRRTTRRLAGLEGVDVVVEGGADETDARVPVVVEPGVVVHAGRQGQGLLVIDLFRTRATGAWVDASVWTRETARARIATQRADLTARLEAWRADPSVDRSEVARQEARLQALDAEAATLLRAPTTDGRAFEARYLELAPDAPRDAEVTARLEAYFRRVNEHNREAFASWTPDPAADGMPHYVGSDRCASCHAEEHAWWRGTPHGRAYATLVERNKEFNLSCVGCHVTGYLRPGGSTVSHTGALQDVGCENCHGPASQHVEAPTSAAVNVHAAVEAATCLGCHTPEHSDTFDFDVYRRMLIMPGHGR